MCPQGKRNTATSLKEARYCAAAATTKKLQLHIHKFTARHYRYITAMAILAICTRQNQVAIGGAVA